MDRRFLGLVIALGVQAALVVPAFAATTLSTVIQNPGDAPFTIGFCAAHLSDTEFGNVDYYFRPSVQYTNAGSKRIVAIKVLFVLRDPFDDELGQQVGLDNAGIAVGSSAHGDWEWINTESTVSKIQCIPYAARFSDATTWTNDFKAHPKPRPPAPATPAPTRAPAIRTPAPRPTPEDHPATCRVVLAGGSQIEIPWENAGCATQRRAFAAARTHPATCIVRLADGSDIAIPWANEGCAAARAAWTNGEPPSSPLPGKPSPEPKRVTIDYAEHLVDGHPARCFLRDGQTVQPMVWGSESCAPAREKWALDPPYMHEVLWDDHDAAPANLDDGHPKYCTPIANKSLHAEWHTRFCADARRKWLAIVAMQN